MNPQIVELIGRNWLVNELLQANLEVALPMRDRGIDLIAFADLDTRVKLFISWDKGGYSTQKPSNKLLNLIDEYKMSSQKRWVKVTDMP